jgi:hypothetical protein
MAEETLSAHVEGAGGFPHPQFGGSFHFPSASLVRLTTEQNLRTSPLDDDREKEYQVRYPKQEFQVDQNLDLRKSQHQPVQSSRSVVRVIFYLKGQAEE